MAASSSSGQPYPVTLEALPLAVHMVEGSSAIVGLRTTPSTTGFVGLEATTTGPMNLVSIFGPLFITPPGATTVTLGTSQNPAVTGVQQVVVRFRITSAPDSGWVGAESAPVTVTVVDRDAPGVFVDPSYRPPLSEGSTLTLWVRLTTPPAADVAIPVALLPTDEADLGFPAVAEVRFVAGQTVASSSLNLVARRDQQADGDQAVTLELGTPQTADPFYAALPATNVTFVVADVDVPGVRALSPSLTAIEGGGSVTTRVVLNTIPLQPVTLSLSTSQATEAVVSPAEVVLDATNWDTGVDISVTAVDDSVLDGDTMVRVVGSAQSADGAYDGLAPILAWVEVRSNERRIFVTSGTWSGSMGGLNGADRKCNADPAAQATTTTFKAMVVAGGSRVASSSPNTGDGQADWVLVPGARYFRPDGTEVGLVGANGLFAFPLSAAVGTSGSTWSGLNSDWTSANTCLRWTLGTDAGTSTRGDPTATDVSFIRNGPSLCNATRRLVCVE